MPVKLDPGMHGERARLRQTQRLPRQICERIGDVEGELHCVVQPLRLGDGLCQCCHDRGREKGVGEPGPSLLQRAFEPSVTRAAVTGITRRSPMAPRPLQPPVEIPDIEIGVRRRAGYIDAVGRKGGALAADR
jgi:hypothetical protein